MVQAWEQMGQMERERKERQRPLDSEEAAALRVTRPERAASCRHEQRIQRTTCARLGGALQLPKLWSSSSARVLQEGGEVEITRDSVGCVRSHARGRSPTFSRARPASPQRIFPSLLSSSSSLLPPLHTAGYCSSPSETRILALASTCESLSHRIATQIARALPRSPRDFAVPSDDGDPLARVYGLSGSQTGAHYSQGGPDTDVPSTTVHSTSRRQPFAQPPLTPPTPPPCKCRPRHKSSSSVPVSRDSLPPTRSTRRAPTSSSSKRCGPSPSSRWPRSRRTVARAGGGRQLNLADAPLVLVPRRQNPFAGGT